MTVRRDGYPYWRSANSDARITLFDAVSMTETSVPGETEKPLPGT
jgi:hypothetical protein